MSGPKDAEFEFIASLLSGFAAQTAAQHTAWVHTVASLRPAVRKNRPAPRTPASSPVPQIKRQALATARPEPRSSEEPRGSSGGVVFSREIADLHLEVEARREAMRVHEGVEQFGCVNRESWEEGRARFEAMPASAAAIEAGKELVLQSEEIVARAIERQEQHAKRAYLLQAIVESLNAVGYFTDEPQLTKAEDPDADITLVARKADQRVTISLPLGEQIVKSTWDGLPGEKCADSFMEYVSALGARGVSCTPCDRTIADRPKLRQAGRKDLPRSTMRGE